MRITRAARLARKVIQRTSTEQLFLRSGLNLTKPNDIRATLTERCNYRCIYCHHWRQESYTDEMSLEEWKSAFSSIRDFLGRFAVQFLGGEPMLVPWFADLVRFCSEIGIDWGVITNGSSLSSARVEALVAADPLNIDISLDSRDASAHDYLRGIRGSMQHVSEGVHRLVEARRRAGARFAIRIKATVTRQTVEGLGEIVTWAETMPSVVVDFGPVRLRREKDIADMYPAGPEEMARLERQIEQLIERKQMGAPIETSVSKLRGMATHFRREPLSHGVGSCRVGLRSIDIRPNGDVDHCFKFKRIGNLREASMRQIWTGQAHREVVDQTVACPLFETTCAMTCLAHRSLRQDIARGVRLIRSKS